MDDTQADHGDETTVKELSIEEQLSAMTAERDALMGELSAVATDKINLTEQLAASQAKLAKATTAAKAKPAQGRKINPGLVSFDPAELADLIGAAETVEVVALDAKHREIAGFGQEIVGGAAVWRLTGSGLRLALPEPLTVTAPGDRASAIHAWGLFLDGKAAVFGKRFEPLVLSAGQKTDLSNDVIF